jgi:YD repeat-containing protein
VRCHPAWWTPPNGQPFEDWFNKYVVTKVARQDTTGGQPEIVTSYCYGSSPGCLGGGAWHYNDDSLIRSKQRTWDQWRGFGKVFTSTGASPDPVTQTEDIYFQGMDGDFQTGGTTGSASVSSTVGGVTVADSRQFAGMDFEHIADNGQGGAMVGATVTTPFSRQTASQSQPAPLPALTAHLTGIAKTQTFTALASGGNREADAVYTFDSAGRITSEADAPDASDNGLAGDASEDTCTQTTYAANATSGLIALPADQLVTSVAPSACPISGTPTQSELVSDTRTYYDGSTTLGAAPSAGDVTQVQQATSFSGATPVYTVQSKAAYDQYGRATSATDADGNVTTTAYTPATGSEPTSVAVTDPQGLVTTTAYDSVRDLPVTVTSPAGQITSKTYDALGRVTAEWLPTASKAGGQDASFTASYSVNDSAPSVITINTLEPGGTSYLPSQTIYDALGQAIETQVETPDGNRDVSATFYNSDGWPDLVFQPFFTSGVPSGTLVSAADSAIPDETVTDYDGASRVIKDITDSKAVEEFETDTAYGGNYTTVMPPQGGTAETTYTDGRGLTSYIYQVHSTSPPASPPAPGSGSVSGSAGWDQTAYSYTAAKQLASITDALGSKTTYGYDLVGNRVTSSGPDSGTTTSTFDANGNVLSTTNAAGTTLSYVYDKDGRRTAEYAAPVASQAPANQLAAWVYDTLARGQLTSSTSYIGGSGLTGQAYTEQVLGYNANGLSKGTETKIPSGPLAGTYISEDFYDAAGQLDEYVDSAAGGLPQETVNIGYDAAADPVSINSAQASYVSALSYTELGQPLEYSFGSNAEPAFLSNSYNFQGQVTEAKAAAGITPATVDDQNYNYNSSGNIVAEADTPAGGPAQVQCFSYDYLGRLVTAWSSGTTGCAAPSQAAESTAAAPYWESFTYNRQNDLTSETSTPPSGAATTYTNTFPTTAGPDGGPHTITSQQAAGPSGTTTTSFGYNASGQTTSISSPSESQSLAWNATGQLASLSTGGTATASYAYDASGSLLLQTDPGSQTLYLPDEQIVANTASGAVSGDPVLLAGRCHRRGEDLGR